MTDVCLEHELPKSRRRSQNIISNAGKLTQGSRRTVPLIVSKQGRNLPPLLAF
ncbi:MAG: hypothetical protein WC364_12735 [Eubacteriales bacterium]